MAEELEYTKEQIIERLRGLLETATRKTTNVNEAANAMAMARRLMERYNLALADVENYQPGKFTEETYSFKARARWRKRLLAIVAEMNFCDHISYRGTRRAVFIGSPVNIQAAKMLFEYLEAALERLAEEGFTAYVDEYYTNPLISAEEYERRASPGNKHSWKEYFYHGACDALIYRLREEKKRFENESAASRALVVVNDQALATYIKEKYNPKIVDDRRDGKKENENAWSAGVNAGLAVPLTKQLEQEAR